MDDFFGILKDLGIEFGSIFSLISKLIIADYQSPSGLGGFAKRKNFLLNGIVKIEVYMVQMMTYIRKIEKSRKNYEA